MAIRASPANGTRAVLDRLEGRGYLTRIRPDHDRRSLQVCLTPAGRALGDAVINALLPTDPQLRLRGPDG